MAQVKNKSYDDSFSVLELSLSACVDRGDRTFCVSEFNYHSLEPAFAPPNKCLKGGREYYLVLETEKSRERAMVKILMIDKIMSSTKSTE